jgi:hypothetical protein
MIWKWALREYTGACRSLRNDDRRQHVRRVVEDREPPVQHGVHDDEVPLTAGQLDRLAPVPRDGCARRGRKPLVEVTDEYDLVPELREAGIERAVLTGARPQVVGPGIGGILRGKTV